jgi:TRAP-type C4-dicarboxylate transport system permease small subunit
VKTKEMSHIRKGILQVEEAVLLIVKWLLFLTTGAMVASVLLAVFFRYVLVDPLTWTEEFSRYMMVWSASLGMAVAFREGSHIAVTILTAQLRGKTGEIISRITQIILIVFMAIVMVEGFKLAFALWTQESPAMQIPMTWPYLAIPVGCSFFIFEGLIMLFFPQPITFVNKGDLV